MKNEQIIMAFDALGNETRLAIFRLLVQNSKNGLNQGELAEKMGNMPRTTLSFHIGLLESAGLCQSEKVGKNVYYKPCCCLIKEIVHFLLADCCEENCKC